MAVVCQYCESVAEFIDSSEIYSRSYGMIYLCRKCGAYVGVHKGTDKPKGILANKELRSLRIKTHGLFDKLWRKGKSSRREAYKWLSWKLKIKEKHCHIGMFNIGTCNKAIAILEETKTK